MLIHSNCEGYATVEEDLKSVKTTVLKRNPKREKMPVKIC